MSKTRKHKTSAKPTSSSHRVSRKSPAHRNSNSNLIYIGVIALALILIAGIFILPRLNQSNTSAAHPLEITTTDAFEKYQDGIFFLDVRTQEEWVDFHAPNSTHIPLDELPSRLDELPRDQEIVVVCRSGNRSQEGRDILRNAGFSNVSSMAGGLNEWRQAGFPVVSGP